MITILVVLLSCFRYALCKAVLILSSLLLHYSSLLPSICPATALTLQARCDVCRYVAFTAPCAARQMGESVTAAAPDTMGRGARHTCSGQLDRLSPRYEMAAFKLTAICEKSMRRGYLTLS